MLEVLISQGHQALLLSCCHHLSVSAAAKRLQSGAYSINAFYIAKTLVTVPYQVGRFVGKKACSLFWQPSTPPCIKGEKWR